MDYPSGTWLQRGNFQGNDALRNAGKLTFPATLVFHRFPQHDFCFLSHESLEVFRLGQLTLQARRADLQRVTVPRYDVLDVQNSSYLLRNKLAIGMRDALRAISRRFGRGPVDVYTQQSAPARPE